MGRRSKLNLSRHLSHGWLHEIFSTTVKEESIPTTKKKRHLSGQTQKACNDKTNPQSHYYQINANSNNHLYVALLLHSQKLKGFRPSNAGKV